jgi:hypothetical protein
MLKLNLTIVFRPYLSLVIYKRAVFPQIIEFINRFAKEMPDTASFSHLQFAITESNLTTKVVEKVNSISALHDDDDSDEAFDDLLTLLSQPRYGGTVEDNGVVFISFKIQDRKLEDLFRLITAKANGDSLHAYAQVLMHPNGTFYNEIKLYLSDLFAFPVIAATLKEFLSSPDGVLI